MALFVEEPLEVYQKEIVSPEVIDILKKNKDKLPPIRFDCGKTDELIEPNRLLHQQLKEAGINHIYKEFDGGHEWAYWVTHVEKTLVFFDTYNLI